MTRFAILLSACLALAAMLSLGSRALADDGPVPLSLVVPNSLTGWSYGDVPPIGWTVDGQRLRGCADGKPLVSAWNVGDFTLEFDWSSVGNGALDVLLPTKPSGDTIAIALADDEHAGKITYGSKQLAAGKKLSATGDGSHRCRIERAGESLKVMIDDEAASEAAVASDRRFSLSLRVPRGVVAIEQLTLREPRGEAIFNGSDLAGWNTNKKQDVWAVENGELTTLKSGGEYLRSDKEYGDFTLTFDYHLDQGGNSGLGIRTPIGKWPSGEGMELQMLDRPSDGPHSQMSIYKHLAPLAYPDKSNEWNHVVVKCNGPMITSWVNGQIAQHANLDKHPQLAQKPRSGWLGFQHHGSPTRIKNVFLLEGPPQAATGGDVDFVVEP